MARLGATPPDVSFVSNRCAEPWVVSSALPISQPWLLAGSSIQPCTSVVIARLPDALESQTTGDPTRMPCVSTEPLVVARTVAPAVVQLVVGQSAWFHVAPTTLPPHG